MATLRALFLALGRFRLPARVLLENALQKIAARDRRLRRFCLEGNFSAFTFSGIDRGLIGNFARDNAERHRFER